ncbi:MAG: response regulator transcription factor [Actinomycetota bacterium]|nr:response regulator transcription factor [Actinomycetota bacterium]
MTQILIAEDEPRIASFLEKGLRSNGFVTTVAPTGTLAASLLRERSFDLVILDLGLPGLDGHQILQELRGRGDQTPVVVLTARDGVGDTVAALDAGANDYVTKPFSFEELLARVRVRLRDGAAGESTVLRAGNVALDLRARRATVDGRTVELTAREFMLIETLMRHPGQVLSRPQLLDQVWGYDFDPESNVVDVYIRYLRQKLGQELIETVRGMGYRLRV